MRKLQTSVLLLSFVAIPVYAQTSVCPPGTTTCTGNNQQPQDMGDTTVDNSNSTSRADQVNPSSNTNGGNINNQLDQKAQTSANQNSDQNINGTISNGSDQAYAHGGTQTSTLTGNQVGDTSATGGSVGNTTATSGDASAQQGQSQSAAGGAVTGVSASGGAGGVSTADGGAATAGGGNAQVANGSSSNSAGGASGGNTIDARNQEVTNTQVDARTIYIPNVVQPNIPVSVAQASVNFMVGECGPFMNVAREPFYVGTKKRREQQGWDERLAGIRMGGETYSVTLPGGVVNTYGARYLVSVSVNGVVVSSSWQVGMFGKDGGAGQAGFGSSGAAQQQQHKVQEFACLLGTTRPQQQAPADVTKAVPMAKSPAKRTRVVRKSKALLDCVRACKAKHVLELIK